MRIETRTPLKTAVEWSWPLLLAYIRLPLVLAGSGIAILAYRLAGYPVGVAAGQVWSTLTLTVINLLCLWLLVQRSKVEDFDIRQAIGFRREALLGDIAWGLLWSILLFGLLALGLFTAIFLLHGVEGFANLESVFVGDADFNFPAPSWLVLVSAIAFPLLNPFVEELQYRGYSQPRLIALSGSLPAGILITSLGFGLQHMVFALTFSTAVAYVFGYFLWSIGAGLIAHRQKRLAPLMVAHFISNLFGGLIPAFLLISGG